MLIKGLSFLFSSKVVFNCCATSSKVYKNNDCYQIGFLNTPPLDKYTFSPTLAIGRASVVAMLGWLGC